MTPIGQDKLPVEVWINICERLFSHRRTLACLSLTCRKLRSCSQPSLFWDFRLPYRPYGFCPEDPVDTHAMLDRVRLAWYSGPTTSPNVRFWLLEKGCQWLVNKCFDRLDNFKNLQFLELRNIMLLASRLSTLCHIKTLSFVQCTVQSSIPQPVRFDCEQVLFFGSIGVINNCTLNPEKLKSLSLATRLTEKHLRRLFTRNFPHLQALKINPRNWHEEAPLFFSFIFSSTPNLLRLDCSGEDWSVGEDFTPVGVQRVRCTDVTPEWITRTQTVDFACGASAFADLANDDLYTSWFTQLRSLHLESVHQHVAQLRASEYIPLVASACPNLASLCCEFFLSEKESANKVLMRSEVQFLLESLCSLPYPPHLEHLSFVLQVRGLFEGGAWNRLASKHEKMMLADLSGFTNLCYASFAIARYSPYASDQTEETRWRNEILSRDFMVVRQYRYEVRVNPKLKRRALEDIRQDDWILSRPEDDNWRFVASRVREPGDDILSE